MTLPSPTPDMNGARRSIFNREFSGDRFGELAIVIGLTALFMIAAFVGLMFLLACISLAVIVIRDVSPPHPREVVLMFFGPIAFGLVIGFICTKPVTP